MVVDYENAWIYTEQPFLSENIGNSFGFVYRITNLSNGRQYIGRKYFVQKRKPKGENVESLQNPIGKSIMDLAPN